MTQDPANTNYLHAKKWLTGIVLIAIGGAFLLEQNNLFGITNLQHIWQYWPLAIGLFGVVKIVTARDAADVVRGCAEIAISFWLFACLTNLWGWRFSTTWPLLLIIGGLSMILRAATTK